MRIERLRLVNFGNHADTDIQLEQINIFVGPNGAGKSTIKQALEYLLTGRVYGVTDAAGRGYESLINLDSDKKGAGYVGAVVDGRSISREIGGKLQGMAEPPGREVISALLNTSRFLELPQKEQQALLFSLLGLSFTTEKILEHLQAWPGVGEKEILTFGKLVNGQADGGPEVFDKLYKTFYNERTSAKRVLKELEALAKQEGGDFELPPGAWDARGKIRADLQALKDRRGQLMRQLGQVTMQLKHRQDVEANIPRLEQEKRELEERIAACWTGDAAAERNADQALAERIEDFEKEKKELQQQADEALKIAAELRAAIGQNEKLIRTLQDAGNSCPLLNTLTCPANKREIAEEIAAETEQIRQAWEKEKARMAEIKEKIAVLDRQIQDLKQERQASREKFAQLDLDRKRLADVEQRLEYFRQQLEEMEQAPAPVELQQEIDELGERIAREEELVRKLAVYEDRSNRQRELQERLERARAEVAALEALVDAFGPAGIRAKLLDEVIERLQARADERMQLMTQGVYRVKIAIPEGVSFTVEKNGVPMKKLSTGERLLLGVVIQDVLAGLAGVRLLVIDDVNHLDQQNKNALMGMLLRVREDYDTVMVFSALGEVAPRDPGIPGVAMWYVNDGQVSRVPAQAAA